LFRLFSWIHDLGQPNLRLGKCVRHSVF
jgi:hypothetical protein